MMVIGRRQNYNYNLQKYRKMVFIIFDVYPKKFGRMNFWGQPRESSHQGASFGTLFAIKSLSKRRVFYDLLQKLFSVFLMFTPHFLIV